MCGISGIINFNNTRVLESEIGRMNGLIEHRGPDGEGFYFGDNFAFGHRRLAILDLSENGHQPMIWKDELVITFNGEIYNYLEIRDQLKALGYKFLSDSDTEVILAAYNEWGQDCVRQFNGMWAFAIYDKAKQQIFCSRDRFGVKPLHYSKTTNQFLFGSEIKQIIELTKSRKFNQRIMLDYLIVGFEEHTDETFFEGVVQLPASHNLVYDLTSHSYSVKRYYDIPELPEVKKLSEQDAVAFYEKEFQRSIEYRMRSDVNVGTCLSGGLDSSSVSAFASIKYKPESNQRFVAVHAKSTEADTDESKMASHVAQHCGLDLHIITPTEKEFIDNIDEVIYTQEEPFGSPSIFMQYFVLKKARELNCIVMLDGQGGDETLLGYEKYFPAYLMSLKGSKKWSGFLNASKNSKLSRKELASYFFYFTRYKIRLGFLKRRNKHIRPEYLKKFQCPELKEMSDRYLNINQLQRFEIARTQLPKLLKFEDRNSMRNSVETRLPFLDYRLVETALSMKDDYKIKEGWTKYVLRIVVNHALPKEIVWRKNKLGFNAPEKTWLNSINEQMMLEIKSSSILNELIDFSKLDLAKTDLRSKWRLFNVARWEKIYHVTVN